MTAVRVHRPAGPIIAQASRELRATPPQGLLLQCLAWLTLAIGTDRWFLFASSQLPEALVAASSFWLLMLGAVVLINASQLLLPPSVTVPAPPASPVRARRLVRVAGIEALVITAAATAIATADALAGGAVTRWAATALVWRDFVWGLSHPGPSWFLAWCAYCLLHTPGLSWLWSPTAANYPSGTLKATATLASRAGRGTPWLAHVTLGSGLISAALGLIHPDFGLLALVPLMLWPAIANTAAGHLQPD